MVKLNMFEIGPVELEVNMACLAKTMGFIDFFPNHYSLWPCHVNINFFSLYFKGAFSTWE